MSEAWPVLNTFVVNLILFFSYILSLFSGRFVKFKKIVCQAKKLAVKKTLFRAIFIKLDTNI